MTKIEQTAAFALSPAPTPIVAFWNDVLASKFVTFRHILEGGLSLHSNAIFPSLDIRQGDQVLDVGCGFGDTTFTLADRVGSRGHVTGVDCCPEFLRHARLDQQRLGCMNADFQVADAEVALPFSRYDFVFARFGTMFFANPVAGLRRMRRALKPGGRLTHVVWRDRNENPWLAAARSVLLDHLPLPNADADSCGPGPFSMADPDLVIAQMSSAGFVDIAFEKVDAKVLVGRTVDEAIAFQLALGPAGEIYRTAGMAAEEKHDRIVADLRDLFHTAPRDDAGIWMDSASWMISARPVT